ncbi:UNVERIFIED_CONTAM: hypothetical protein Sradi_0490700 [Sesamum radiatum]|uniref:Aminotransferase-like plant mobile domain-containing protein n=1 Tax=Sesamum radiatum TaxID=300843 RepID=A0AAW2W8J3_SESRA
MTKQKWQNYCHQWLGFQPNENSFKNVRIKLAALLDRLLNHTYDDDSPFEEVLQEARVCVMCLIGGLLCPDATGNTVSLLYLRHMENIDQESTSNWGTAVLAYLYRELCTASQRGKTNIGNAMQLLQIWVWSRIITLAPIPSNNVADLMPTIDDPENILPVPPYARRLLSQKQDSSLGQQHTFPFCALSQEDSSGETFSLRAAWFRQVGHLAHVQSVGSSVVSRGDGLRVCRGRQHPEWGRECEACTQTPHFHCSRSIRVYLRHCLEEEHRLHTSTVPDQFGCIRGTVLRNNIDLGRECSEFPPSDIWEESAERGTDFHRVTFEKRV